TLSGGEQQMLAIGRCLMGAPELVMFDEPSLGLAPAVVQQLLRTIRDLNREGLTCVLVEQNVAVSLKLAAHAYVLESGRVALAGAGEWVLADDRVRGAYLGLWGVAARSGAGYAAGETIVTVKRPTPSISHSSLSPGPVAATPEGVPVMMISPAASSTISEGLAMISGTFQIICPAAAARRWP